MYRFDAVGYGEQDGKIVQFSEDDTLLQIGALDEQGIKVLLIHYPITPERTAQIVKRARELGMATIGELGLTTYEELGRPTPQDPSHLPRRGSALAS